MFKVYILIGAYHHLRNVEHIKDYLGGENSIIIVMPSRLSIRTAKDLVGYRYEFVTLYDLTLKDLLFRRDRHKHNLRVMSSLDGMVFHCQYLTINSLLFFSKVDNEQYRLLDEGTASFGVVKRRVVPLKDYLKSFLVSLLILDVLKYPASTTFYSYYPLKVSDRDRLFPLKRESINIDNVTSNAVCVLGSSMCTMGIMKQSVYNRLLEVALEPELEIIYVPHRKEKVQDLSDELLGKVTIQSFGNMPFEVVLRKGLFVPNKIIAVQPSTTLLNIGMFYKGSWELVGLRTTKSNYRKEKTLSWELSELIDEAISV